MKLGIIILIILTLFVSGCAVKNSKTEQIILKNITVPEVGNQTSHEHNIKIEIFNDKNHPLKCNILVFQGTKTTKHEAGEINAFETKNISLEIQFPEGNTTTHFSTECTTP